MKCQAQWVILIESALQFKVMCQRCTGKCEFQTRPLLNISNILTIAGHTFTVSASLCLHLILPEVSSKDKREQLICQRKLAELGWPQKSQPQSFYDNIITF